MHRLHLTIKGLVQGVFFRASTQREANRLGLSGWVRNLYDGNVEVVAEGEKNCLEKFLTWCHHGPPLARVTGVEVEWEEATGEFKGFSLKH